MIMWLSRVGRRDEGRFLTLPSKNWKDNPLPTPSPFPPFLCRKEMTGTRADSSEHKDGSGSHSPRRGWRADPTALNCWLVHGKNINFYLGKSPHFGMSLLQQPSQYSYKYSNYWASAVAPDQAPSHSLNLIYWEVAFILSICNMGCILCNECFFLHYLI